MIDWLIDTVQSLKTHISKSVVVCRLVGWLVGWSEGFVKDTALIWVSSKTGWTPPPTKNFGTFCPLFQKSKLWNFWGTFVRPNSPNICGKSSPNLLCLVNPPPFSTTNSKNFDAKKMSQNFWIASEPPTPPYGRNPN